MVPGIGFQVDMNPKGTVIMDHQSGSGNYCIGITEGGDKILVADRFRIKETGIGRIGITGKTTGSI